jgi:hypothetical protein
VEEIDFMNASGEVSNSLAGAEQASIDKILHVEEERIEFLGDVSETLVGLASMEAISDVKEEEEIGFVSV